MTESACPECGNTELWSGNFDEIYCRKCAFIYLCWIKENDNDL